MESVIYTMLQVRQAIEASWGADTAYKNISEPDNPSKGNCYASSRVLQYFFPELDIAKGIVWTGQASEKHYWNVLMNNGQYYHIDLTWQQFPHGSIVEEYVICNRRSFADNTATKQRVAILLERTQAYLYDKHSMEQK